MQQSISSEYSGMFARVNKNGSSGPFPQFTARNVAQVTVFVKQKLVELLRMKGLDRGEYSVVEQG
jgi:hypothetical protein